MKIYSIFLIVIIITIVGINSVYGELPQIDGTVDSYGCTKILGGKIINVTVNNDPRQHIQACEFNDKQFRITSYDVCTENVVDSKDPETGKVYQSSPCSVPKICGFEELWGEDKDSIPYHNELFVEYEGKKFRFDTFHQGDTCTLEEFSIAEKKLSVFANGILGTTVEMRNIMPQELLGGEFEVMVDGKSIPFDIERTETDSIIVYNLEFSPQERKVEIVGTEVIPEFSNVGMIIFMTILSTILVSIFSKKNRLLN